MKHLYQFYCRPVRHGKVWKEVDTKLRVFESNCLRKIMNIKQYEHVMEEEMKKRNGLPSVIQKWKDKR